MQNLPSNEVGRMVIQNRFTGEILKEGVPVFESDVPFQVPDPEVIVWRYLDWFKFEDLVVNRRLYFRRADRLDDHMEGRFSAANRQFQTSLWQRFNEAYAIKRDPEQEQQINEMMRYRVFMNCWHINANESTRMWKLYTKSLESVVIRSKCCLLDSSTDGRAYQPVLVRYVNQQEPRPEFHSLAPFVFKDTSFGFENEVRLLAVPDLEETIYLDQERDFYRTLPVRPEELILEVRTHPAATNRFRRRVAKLCADFLPRVEPRHSALEKGAAQ
jgi:hypothetical protein